MGLHEIVTPDTKPETEWILGRAVRKVSPRTKHALLQTALVVALSAWTKRGVVGTEWKFRIAPGGEIMRPLVPDVAYVANDQLFDLEGRDADYPPFAPTVAFEILSPDNRTAYVDHKIDVYLAGGSSAVVIIDPKTRSVRIIDPVGTTTSLDGDAIEHPSLPGFSLGVTELFQRMELPRRPATN